jgi:hypothetical protein
MKSKIQFSLLTAFAICGALTTTAVFVGNAVSENQPKAGQATDVSHSLVMDATHQIVDAKIKVNDTYSFAVDAHGYTAGSGNFGSMTAGGYIVGDGPMYGIDSITANLVSGSIRANFSNYGSSWERRYSINSANFVNGTASTVAIEGNPDCFYLEFPTASVITSITIHYGCSFVTEPTQESNDLLDFSKEAEGLDKAQDLSWKVSTSHVASGSTRSHEVTSNGRTYGSDTWPTLFIQLKTPVAVTSAGKFAMSGYALSGHAWAAIELYDTSWNKIGSGTLIGFDFSTSQFAECTGYSACGGDGTVGLIRLSIHEDTTAPVDLFLDNLRYIAG